MSWPSPRKDFLISVAAILLLALAGYGFLWEPGKTPYSPYSDFIAAHAATKQVLYDSIHQGRGIPFWRGDQFSGYAGLINPQSQFTHPLSSLFYFMRPLAAAGGTFFLCFTVSALAYYAAGAALGLGFWPKLAMAVAGLFSFKLIVAVYAGWLSNITMVVCLPLVYAAVFHLARKPALKSSLLLAGAGTLCLHAGHLQLLYYSAWFLAAYLLIRAIGLLRAGKAPATGTTGLWLAVGSILAVGLSAYLLLPLAAESPLVSRSRTTYEFFLSDHASTPLRLATFLFPEVLGTPLDGSSEGGEIWEDVAYFGLIPLLLSAAGVVLGWRRPNTKYLTACFVSTVLLSMDSPALRLLYDWLPGFSLFRIPGRFLFLSTFFGIALAGIGLEEVIGRLRRKTGGARVGPAVAAALIALMAAEGSGYARRYLTMVPQGLAAPTTEYQRYLGEDSTLFRVAPILRSTVNHGWAAAMGLQLITGYDSFNYRHYNEYFDLMRWGRIRHTDARVWNELRPEQGEGFPRPVTRSDMLDVLNVKYLISPTPLTSRDGRFELVRLFPAQPMFALYQGARRADLYLYKNRHFLPRAFWADRVIVAEGAGADVSTVQQTDISAVAIVDRKIEGLPAVSRPAAPAGAAEISEARNGYLAIETGNPAWGYLVISEIWHPGWRAQLDGKEAPLYRTNLALLGLAVPPGAHRLVLEFRPLMWKEGITISIASVLALIFLGAWPLIVSRGTTDPPTRR